MITILRARKVTKEIPVHKVLGVIKMTLVLDVEKVIEGMPIHSEHAQSCALLNVSVRTKDMRVATR